MPDTEKEALCARIDELCAEVERLRQENQSIGMAAYEVGYRNGSIHYELEHCPACKNIVDLQEALEENAKLRELATYALRHIVEVWCDGEGRDLYRGKPCEDCADAFSSDCPKCMPRMFDVSGIEVVE